APGSSRSLRRRTRSASALRSCNGGRRPREPRSRTCTSASRPGPRQVRGARMFKSLRERLAGWQDKAEAEATPAAIGDAGRKIKEDKLEEILYDPAIEQLEKHAEAIGFKLIKHQAGADPAAVAFDAVEHARARGRDVVLIDTAGRMQTNQNLMDQMKKIKRVAKPNLILYIGDALAGNDAIEQAKQFHEAVGIDGIVLTKIDA